MDQEKLKRSLLPRVRERLEELLPAATIAVVGERIRIETDDFDGSIGLDALAASCHTEDRKSWGQIAGSFCNLVVSKVRASEAPPLVGDVLTGLLPALVPSTPREDALIREATPDDGLTAASEPWLPGIRIELLYEQPEGRRRVLLRDVAALGLTTQALVKRATENLQLRLPAVKVVALADDPVGRRIFTFRAEAVAPTLLLSPEAHRRMYAVVTRFAEGPVKKILALAPRSDTLFFCDLKDKAATSRMAGAGWADNDADADEGIPLTPRLFTVGEGGEVKYLDVGIGADRVADWKRHVLGPVALRAPPDWRAVGSDGKWIVSPPSGPRVRVRLVNESTATSPGAPPAPCTAYTAHALAERLKARVGSVVDTGHGFFNGLPWAWVDTGFHDGHATASMFVASPKGIVVLQTEVPEHAEPAQGVTLQKVVATIAPVE